MQFHRGRLVDHIRLVTSDLEASRAFYEAVLEVLGVAIERSGEDWFLADELLVIAGKRRVGSVHLALQAKDQKTVQQFFAVALKAGGKKVAAPGKGDAHPFYYSATVKDPDGYGIEAVYHGPLTRSAPAVVVKASALGLLKGLF